MGVDKDKYVGICRGQGSAFGVVAKVLVMEGPYTS